MAAAEIFLIGTLLACLASGRWLLNGEINIINALASFNAVSISGAGGWVIPKGVADFLSACATAFSWNYPFLSSPWCIPLRMFLWVVSIGVIYGLLEVAIVAVTNIVGTIRNLF